MDSILKIKLVYSNYCTSRQFIPNGLHPAAVNKIKSEFEKDNGYPIAEIYNQYDGNIPFFHCNLYSFFNRFYCNETEQNIISIDEVDENSTDTIYLYPIEIKTTTSSLSKKQYFKLDGIYYEYTLLDTLSEKEIHLLRSKKMLLVINMIHDPMHYPDDILNFEKLLNELGIDGSVCNYVLANSYDGHKKYGSRANIYRGIVPLNQYSNWLQSTISSDKNQPGYPTGALGYDTDFVLPTDIDKSIKRKKKFLCFNRTMRPHRVVMCYLAIKHGWLQDGLFSFIFPFHENDINSLQSIEKLIRDTYPEETDANYYAKKICDMLPLELDTQHLSPKEKSGFASNNNNKEFYSDTYLHIVSETSFFVGNEYPTLTEKTFRPICNLQPFIQLGDANSLKLIRELGFKTFSPYIDESYDDEMDPIKRFKLIERELIRIHNMTEDEIHDWYHSMIDILVFNQRYMKTFINHNSFEDALNKIKENWR